MARFTTKPGANTFELISRVVYGSEENESLLRQANSGIIEPIQNGTVIIVPVVPQPRAPVSTPKENTVTVTVDNKQFASWTDASITRSIDSPGQFSLTTAPDEGQRAFRPFTFSEISVAIGTDQVFFGTLMGVNPTLETISINAYSLPGVLDDCTSPAGVTGLEFNGQTLLDICKSLCAPFGIGVVLNGSQGEPFGGDLFDNPVAIGRSEAIMPFIVKLAKQRGLLVGDTADGQLLLHSPTGVGGSVARLVQGEHPLREIVPAFNHQGYYSEISGTAPSDLGNSDGDLITTRNKFLSGVLRPSAFTVSDADGGVGIAVNSRLARMTANAASYSASVADWRDANGQLWTPGDIVSVTAGGAMISSNTPLMIRSVTFTRSANQEHATINLVIPGSFGGNLPDKLPWEDL